MAHVSQPFAIVAGAVAVNALPSTVGLAGPPLTLVARAIAIASSALPVVSVALPLALVSDTACVGASPVTLALAFVPLTDILGAVGVGATTFAMALILLPLPVVRETAALASKFSIAVAQAMEPLALVGTTVFVSAAPVTMRLSFHELTLVLAAPAERLKDRCLPRPCAMHGAHSSRLVAKSDGGAR
eukprot:CAMPEP_0117572180 /NCGR_PEP_ID=MMETSP0784-20121206/60190_1 /TAXON_ID=39447 /ORGANISM="" /LENGTH=186 /DNA_ID=CAMNT_0005370475 /DNA_START=105 /DNA_END=666 /DNA_ORIENTATION=-